MVILHRRPSARRLRIAQSTCRASNSASRPNFACRLCSGRDNGLFTGLGYAGRGRGSALGPTGATAMSMQTVASPAMTFTPPKRNSLTHIPGDEGWPMIGKTLDVLADPKGQVERIGRQIRPGLSQPYFRRDQPGAARARGQRARAVRPGQAVLLDAWLGPDPRPVVSARADAARFRGASPAPPRAVGRLQIRADEILSRRARHRHRGAGRAMEGAAGTDAVLSGDEAAHARPRRDLVPRRRYRPRGRRDHARLCRHGGGLGRRDPQAAARHQDGARRQGPRTHRGVFLRADSDPPRQGRRRPVLAAVPRHP